MALPLFSIEEGGRRRKQPLTYETDVTLNEVPGEFTWQVSADLCYAFPDAFDRKVFKILEALILQNERPIEKPDAIAVSFCKGFGSIMKNGIWTLPRKTKGKCPIAEPS
jgi:hypothetical protein